MGSRGPGSRGQAARNERPHHRGYAVGIRKLANRDFEAAEMAVNETTSQMLTDAESMSPISSARAREQGGLIRVAWDRVVLGNRDLQFNVRLRNADRQFLLDTRRADADQ